MTWRLNRRLDLSRPVPTRGTHRAKPGRRLDLSMPVPTRGTNKPAGGAVANPRGRAEEKHHGDHPNGPLAEKGHGRQHRHLDANGQRNIMGKKISGRGGGGRREKENENSAHDGRTGESNLVPAF